MYELIIHHHFVSSIFHHNPENDDEKMSHIESACKKIDNNFIVAKEGMFYNIK